MNYQIRSAADYEKAYQLSVQDPESFWAGIASHFHWHQPWNRVLNAEFHTPHISWFEGARTNLSFNCLDRHLEERGGQIALIWESNDPTEAPRKISYSELHLMVLKFSQVLKGLGISKGKKVCIYMPMVPEAAVAMLACARLGAAHTVVFAGFSAQSLSDRINDSESEILITADGFMRGDKKVQLKPIADEAMLSTPSVRRCIVYNRMNWPVHLKVGRDLDWNNLMEQANGEDPLEWVEAETPSFLLYTSGSTGKPKGILHTTAGYMVYAGYTFSNVFQYRPGEVFWCTADIGWVTGHSYLVYGPLLNGATTLMFEGTPNYPDAGRFWDVVDKYKVNIFYTAPTAIRALEALGLDPLKGKSLESLRVLGSVGEPINEEAWEWYHKHIGKERCPITDTWWQTETGGIMMAPLPGITALKPGYACIPLPGVQPVIVDEQGRPLEGNGVEGRLCIAAPWPGMARSIYGDHERFRQTYFSTYPGYYFTGDGCKRDVDGYYRITGRVDDVINVSGHRIGTGELESAINEHEAVVESAVVAYPHDVKGSGIYAYVILCQGNKEERHKMQQEIRDIVVSKIGAFAKPDKIQIVNGLPKTRSGKIMRRILRKIAEGDTSNLGDTSTLMDPAVVDQIIAGAL